MERLTEKRDGKNVIPLRNMVCGVDLPYWEISRVNELVSFLYGDAADRLAAYEDAEEQGLPQKTVYVIEWGEGINCDHICPASIDGVGCCSLCDNGDLIIYEEECHQEHLAHIGKTVFLTREEAEKALEGKE